jgi:hypothetical protein
MPSHSVSSLTRRLLCLISLLVLLLNACSFSFINIPGINSPTSVPAPVSPTGPTSTPQASAAITFNVTIPAPLPAGEVLYFSMVDEITGLDLNPSNVAMQSMDPLHYTATIPFAMSSIVKYRYMRQGKIATLEDTSADKTVRYRMYDVTGPGQVEDVVSAWSDGLFSSPYGRVTGQVVDSSNNNPIPNILIAAGGQQILSDSTGKFSLEELPVGTHNLVAYSIDGSYQTFQQGASVDAGKTTPVTLSLTKAAMVNVVFTVSVPASTLQNVPIRLAGDLYQLGNTFGDLQGGLSTVATRMPVLAPLADGRYSITLTLPAGAFIRYKYTLGDGFWNAEHTSDGAFNVRQLIVPVSQGPVQVQDTIQTWQAGASSPILFEVNVPANTPVSDIVSIQFNPYGWTEPMPMWPRGGNQWIYQLYSPLNMLGNFEYRYCRNDQCGVADDVQTSQGKPGRPVSTSLSPQDLQDTVTGWNLFQPATAAPVVGVPVTTRQAGFWAGMEFFPGYDPTWQTWLPLAVQDVKSLHANWLVLSPSWSISRTNPLVFSPVPGADPLWADMLDTTNHARAASLSVAMFPSVNLPSEQAAWWQSAPRDQAWWNNWFSLYAAFAAYHADLAAKSSAQALILGGDWVTPALPAGQVNGANSGVPADAETRWEAIIADVRHRFSGQVLWAVSYPGDLQNTPLFAKSLDGIYLLWSAPLSGSSLNDLKTAAGQLLDKDIQPFQTAEGKPVILAAAVPSADGAAVASLPAQSFLQLPGKTQAQLNLQAQADDYQALIAAVNERAWLGGFISRGYYPPAAMQDVSDSVHGKPAENELWYWFGKLLGVGG